MDDLVGPHVQIVLGVIEGQGFGFLNNPVLVTGSLNGHVLESDVVGPCECPVFSTNLIWQADKKGVRLMRSGSIPMKIECFTINRKKERERIGYLLLSLRSIQIAATGKITNIHQSWNKLMGVRNEAKACHPMLLLSFHVEDDRNKNEIVGNSPKILPATSPCNSARHSTLVPRLCSEEGLIQIGPEQTCSDIFLLSILIGTATNIEMLLKDYQEVNNYSFWYSVFGHSIQTKPFYRNLRQPCALNEKIVLRLRSSLEVLKIYFTEVSLMKLKLLSDETELGYANMELKSLVPTDNLTEFCSKYAINNAVTQNARCYLYATVNGEIPNDGHGRRPFINMEIKLKYLESPKSASRQFDQPIENSPKEVLTAHSSSELQNSALKDTSNEIPLRSTSLTGLEPEAVTSCYQEPTPRIFIEAGDCQPNTACDLFKDIPLKPHQNALSTGKISDRNQSLDLYPSKSAGNIINPLSLPITPTEVDSENAYHRYSLTVTVESVTFLRNLTHKVLFRFYHPKAKFLYSSHTEITPNFDKEIALNDVQSIFHFVSTPDKIGQLLLSWPPKISLCENSSGRESSNVLGELSIDTSLLFVDKVRYSSTYVSSLYHNTNSTEIAKLKITMAMADCGLKSKNEIDTEACVGPPILDERIAYKLIEELEDWKDKQQEIFKTQLAKKEEQRLLLLSNEWNHRRAELEAKLSKGVEKCRLLAANLQQATEEQKLKTAKCLDAETKYKCLKDEIEYSFGMKSHDLKEISRKLNEEYNSKISVLKTENEDLVQRISALERENALLKDTIKTNENDFKELQKSTLTADQSASLLQDLKNLEEKLEASVKSKAFFKEEWGKAVREIHRMKSEHQKQLQNQIRINKEELSNIRIKNILNEEDFELKNDRYALSKIRSNLQSVKNEGSNTKLTSCCPDEYQYTTSRPDLLDIGLEEKAAMLVEERDALLRTGSYCPEDPVIVQLNQELQNVLNHHNNL